MNAINTGSKVIFGHENGEIHQGIIVNTKKVRLHYVYDIKEDVTGQIFKFKGSNVEEIKTNIWDAMEKLRPVPTYTVYNDGDLEWIQNNN